MPSISAVIITFNEEEHIEKCLASLKNITDEIVVVDSFSTDRTAEICNRYGCKFILHAFEGYREQKNWALRQAKSNYILSLDGDELLSEALKVSILQVKSNWHYDAYYFNRKNNYYGKWMRFSGMYPDRKIRLFDRRKVQWGGINPHDKIVLTPGSSKKFLKGDLLHYVQSSTKEHLEKIKSFTTISAKSHAAIGKKSSWVRLWLSPTWKFFWNYFIRLGFLEGKYGYKVCVLNAYSGYLKHLKIRQLSKKLNP